MSNFIRSRKILQWISLFGVLGVIFYMIHVFVGASLYPGYSHMSQAISDLTADRAASASVAKIFSRLYGICMVVGCVAMSMYFRNKCNKIFYRGLIVFTLMQIISAVGYSIFPLTKATDSTTTIMEFQDIMHLVITALVVLMTIISLILLAVGAYKEKIGWFVIIAVLTLICLALGGIGTGVFSEAYLGVFERINIFSLQLFSSILSIWTFIKINR